MGNEANNRLHGKHEIVLVSEYLCGGAWPEPDLPASLVKEGRAMLEAVVDDLSHLPDTEILTTWDQRLPPPAFANNPQVTLHHITCANEELSTFKRLARSADRTLIIAPEFDQILEKRCRYVLREGGTLLNSSPEAIRLCTDKLQVFHLCRQSAIPTIETIGADSILPQFPCVIKLRDGAGSSGMRLISTQAEWNRWSETIDLHRYLTQPFVPGLACSAAAIINQGQLRFVLPMTQQQLSVDGRFQYLGGTIPALSVDSGATTKLIESFIQLVPGLHGYIGFDFLLSEETNQLLFVEVNPRLTTSYVGYRKMATTNLSAWIMNPAHISSPNFRGQIQFKADGRLLEYVV